MAWDLGDTSYTSKTLSISNPRDIFFRTDGLKCYISEITNDAIQQYSLSTAWDLSTATSDSVSLVPVERPVGIFFKSDGTKLYVCCDYYGATIEQYSLSTAWDLSTATYDSVSLNVAGQDTQLGGLWFSTDGTKLFLVGNQHNYVYQYNLTTGWDLSSATYSSNYINLTSIDATPLGLTFKPDGLKMFVLGSGTDSVLQFSLTTAWDISTASYDSISFYAGTQETYVWGLFIDSSGSYMYVVGIYGTIYEYTLASLTDVSEIPEFSNVFSLSCNVTNFSDITEFEVVNSLGNDIKWVDFNINNYDLTYIFTLTGQADGYDNVDIPITSFQCRLRSGSNSYLSVVIPGFDQMQDITDRANGEMIIYLALTDKISGLFTKIEIARVNFSGTDSIRIDQGTISEKITLTGYRQETYEAKSVTVTEPSNYKSIVNGNLTYRFTQPIINLNPGDTVIINDDEFTVSVISIYAQAVANGIQFQMDVQENG